MAIFIKNDEQITKMRIAGRITGDTLALLEKNISPGISTSELAAIADEFIRSRGAVPSFLNYDGFPGTICVSLNEQVIHGIPGIRKLKNGDIVSIDVGAYIGGFHGDASRTFAVGEISEENKLLIEVTERSFFEGMGFATAGRYVHEISAAIGSYAESYGFGVVREFVGHGIGTKLHEAPQVPNFRQKTRGPRMEPGMTLAIEPMLNIGVSDVYLLDNNWTVVTRDGKASAHYENTILITDGQPEILTAY